MRSGQGGEPLRVAVVGGGITGLSAAYYVLRLAAEQGRPCRLTLFEQDGRLGGKVRSEAAGGFLMEAGPDGFLLRKPWMAELCRELGLGEQMVPIGGAGAGAAGQAAPGQSMAGQGAAGAGAGGAARANGTPSAWGGAGGAAAGGALGTYIWAGGRLHPLPAGSFLGIPAGIGPLVGSSLLSWPGKLRLALEPMIPPRREETDESVAAFARRRLGREAAERLVEPLLSGIFGGDASRLSVEAAFPMLRDMERRYGSLWAAMRASAQRRAASGQRGGGGGSEGALASLRNGLEGAVAALRAELERRGADVRLGQAVTGLRLGNPEDGASPAGGQGGPGPSAAASASSDGAGEPVKVLQLEGGQELAADRVILAVPAPAAARIVRGVAPEAAGLLESIAYAGAASVYLGYRQGDVPRALDGTGYLTVRQGERPVRACTWVSSKWPHTVRGGGVLMRLHMGPYGGREPSQRSDEELVAEARQEMARVMGIQADPVLVRVFRWPAAIPQYEPGHRARVEAIEAAVARIPGLYVAGAAYRGVGLPDCVRQGREAAERALSG